MCYTKVKKEKMKNMLNYFSIGEAAEAAHTTTETLRHYDRIGLVQPSKRDEWTNYRYYTEQDIIRLNTVRALQLMDLSLKKIQKVLEYDDPEKILAFLAKAEKKVDEKIAALQYSKQKIQSARLQYGKVLKTRRIQSSPFIKEIPERVILLSDTLEEPTLNNLWNYLSHFYEQVTPALKAQFDFEDQAGIYTENGLSRLFAICIRYGEIDGLRRLPKGTYLCTSCTETDKETKLHELVDIAKTKYGVQPQFTLQLIVVSGILQWNYEVQVFIGKQ